MTASRSDRALILIALLSFSALTVYTQYVFLQTTDLVTNLPFRTASLAQYHEILDGTRPYPYQWRVAGPWIVRAGEIATGRDPHAVDVVVKIAALALSAFFFVRFTALWTSGAVVAAAAASYFLLTAAAYSSEGYSIYYTNDFLMVAGWNAAVYFAATRQWGLVAVATFLTAWAKETLVLAPLLAALAWRHDRASARDVVLVAAAFVVPTAFLRTHYPAPLQYWAWWHNVAFNVPFVRPERDFVVIALRDNLKLLVFFNVLLVLGWRAFAGADRFLKDLVHVGLIYAALAYVVVYIRELRHFLPLLIVLLPLAGIELGRRLATAEPGRS